MKRGESETAEDFGARVQEATAADLCVQTSNHTVADKVRLKLILSQMHVVQSVSS